MLIVTGASGKLGRKIVENLLLHVPAREIGVSVRDPNKALDMQARGVRVRQGDFSDAASIRHAWAGAKRLLLIPPTLLQQVATRWSNTPPPSVSRAKLA